MNLRKSKSFLISLFIAGIFLLGANQSVMAATFISAPIAEDTVWTASSSPYILDSIEVASGAKLTLEAGTVIKLSDGAELTVDGILESQGTEAEPVYITSVHDDTVGGDSNNNGASTVPTAAKWRSVHFTAGSSANLDYTAIRYAGYRNSKKKIWPAIYNTGGSLTISNSVITDSSSYGIGQTSGSLHLSNSNVERNMYGVAILEGSTTLIGNTFRNNTTRAVLNQGSGNFELTSNNFIDNNITADIDLSNERTFTHSGNTGSGNSNNGLVIRGVVDGAVSLGPDELPYLIPSSGGLDATGEIIIETTNYLTVGSTGSIAIEPGVVIKFIGSGSQLIVNGVMTALGTPEQSIYFTSHTDDTVGGDSNNDGSSTAPKVEDWREIKLNPGSQATLDNVVVRYAGGSWRYGGSSAGLYNNGGMLTITNSEISNNRSYGILHTAGATIISDSSIHDHPAYGVRNQTLEPLDARHNYWGDPSGPYHSTLNPAGLGDNVSDNVLFDPWTSINCTENCYSNILFLPGIMASRLAVNGNQLWEPDDGDADIDALKLNDDGTSITTDMIATEVVDEFQLLGLSTVNIYKSFLDDLSARKETGSITDYTAYPYDWRLSLEDIMSDEKLIEALYRLASSSKSGKVTIIAHSNGGLLAKVLVNALGNEASELVDKMIFVGVPQLGTPQAIGALLHGYESGIKFTLDNAQARDFAQNAPFAYQLLPHDSYSNNTNYSVQTPLISFAPGEATANLITTYGNDIYSGPVLQNFLNGTDGRTAPAYDDLESPVLANSGLLQAAINKTAEYGYLWQPPAGIEVHQIAGTGELTVAGITYKTFDECTGIKKVLSGWFCDSSSKKLGYTPIRVIDGDGTVVEPSALAMVSGGDVKNWWVDLRLYNDFDVFNPRNERNHKDLLEIDDLRALIFDNLIESSPDHDFTFVSATQPVFEAVNRLSFYLHSPLSLSFAETDGITVDEDNPVGKYARYSRYGEVKIVDVYDNQAGELKLAGEKAGSFSLELEQVSGGEVVSSTTYSGIPSSTSTAAVIEVNGGSINDTGNLDVDFEGDGSVDFTLTPRVGEMVVLEEENIDEPRDPILEFKDYVTEHVSNKRVKRNLLSKINNFEKIYNLRQKLIKRYPFYAKLFKNNYVLEVQLKALDNTLRLYEKRGQIDDQTAVELRELLKIISNTL